MLAGRGRKGARRSDTLMRRFCQVGFSDYLAMMTPPVLSWFFIVMENDWYQKRPVEQRWAVAWTASWKSGRTHTFGPGSMSFCLIFTVVSMNPEQLPMSSGWEGRLVGGLWLSSSSPSSSCSCFPSSSSSCSSSSPSLDPTDPGGSSFWTA